MSAPPPPRNGLKALLVKGLRRLSQVNTICFTYIQRVFYQCLNLIKFSFITEKLFQNKTTKFKSPFLNSQNESLQSKLRHSECGMTLLEILVITVILATISLGGVYYMTQSKAIMKSLTQKDSCPKMARNTLEQFIGFGTRIYGYSYDGSLSHKTNHPKFQPLLLTKKSTTGINNFVDLKSGSTLKFPDIVTNILNKLPVNMGLVEQEIGSIQG